MNFYARWGGGCVLLLLAAFGAHRFGYDIPGVDGTKIDAALGLAPVAQVSGSEQSSSVSSGPGVAASTGGQRGGGRRGNQDGPVPVVVAPAQVADVPVYLRGVGAARAPNTVTVRPQVDGKLIKVHFKEGQDVKKGDLLAEIDPATYQAALDQAIAKRNLTQSLLTNAELDLDRYSKTGPGVTATKVIDTQRALVAQNTAQLKSDEAAIANAQAVLNYTRLTSPPRRADGTASR